MVRSLSAAATLSAAIGLALGLQATTSSAGETKDAAAPKLEKCYGINAVGKNDCAAGAHSCAGQATKARDPQSFVVVPAGACEKIDGGKTKAS